MGRELSSLEDALAVIRDLSAFIDKQAEEILNLKKELAATRAEIIPLNTENAALKKQNAKLESENAWLKRQIFGSKYLPSHPHARSQESKIFGRVFLPLNGKRPASSMVMVCHQ